jgi:acyl-CoA synthetase (AMP-forming)/AMP-acid ligase II
VSPTEVEEIVYSSGLVGAAAAIGVPHPRLGQAIVLVASALAGSQLDASTLLIHCQRVMPPYMVPLRIMELADLPRNPNGKIDRKRLAGNFSELFLQEGS